MTIPPDIILGFEQILQPINLFYCFVGVLMGTLVGVLPGIGPTASISLLLPLALVASPLQGIVMLSGIYYGAMYGGSTTSILVNIPGEAASVVTCLDGHEMARQGRAGPALGISAFGSFIGGTLSVVALMLLAIPLSKVALKLGPAEYFGLLCVGILLVLYLSHGSLSKSLTMAVIGFLLGCVGTDETSGKVRFAFGFYSLYDGLDIVPMVVGLFGISEVLLNLENPEQGVISKTKVKNLLPNLEDWKKSLMPILRGSVLGFFIGLIPGGGTVLSSFVSYAIEKKVSKHPEEFGKGAIEGVAGPETANNASVGGSFIPLFGLGIPSNVVMALLLACFTIHGIAPGPNFIAKNQTLFWAIIASMYIGNVMLVILNLPLIGIWVKLLKIPYRLLFPWILLFCVVGCYSVNSKSIDVLVGIIFGVLGYILKKLEYEPAPIALAFVLGPMFELSFRQTMSISGGSFGFFLQRPVALAAILLCVLLLFSTVISRIQKMRWQVLDTPNA